MVRLLGEKKHDFGTIYEYSFGRDVTLGCNYRELIFTVALKLLFLMLSGKTPISH